MNAAVEAFQPAAPAVGGEAPEAYAPPPPKRLADTGLAPNFHLNLMLKVMYALGLELGEELSRHLKLPAPLIKEIFEDARNKGLMMLGDAPDFSMHLELHFQLTEKGRERALEALEQSHYAGPAPVPMAAFLAQIERQSITNEHVDPESLRRCFEGVFVPDALAGRIGAALAHGHSILLYGPPGNGKTIYSEAVVRSFKQPVYLPHALEVDGQVIGLFDEAVHEPWPDGAPAHDARWVRCRRPRVIAGGELTMDMLELIYDPNHKVYEAPLQLKATGGVFIIDDFGRQSVPPARILNRWIVPLERKRDYLALHSGKKVAVPFDELLIFSTNLEPEDFMDGAMMRRIHHKIEIGPPERGEFEAIFADVCAHAGVELPGDLIDYLYERFYDTGAARVARFHPRWIVDQVRSACTYEGVPVRLDRARVAEAMENLIVRPRSESRERGKQT